MHLKLVWKDSYNINEKEVDEAHKHFFDVANSIYDLSDKNIILPDELILKITELGDYVFYHFSKEEESIKKCNEIDAEFHINEHNDFRAKISDYIKRAGSSGADIKKLTDEIANFVEEWILGHISQITKEIKTNNEGDEECCCRDHNH